MYATEVPLYTVEHLLGLLTVKWPVSIDRFDSTVIIYY